MRKTNSRIISLILALALVFSMLPLSIFAEGDAVSDGRGTGKYANEEETLTYDVEANEYLVANAAQSYTSVNDISAACNVFVTEFDFRWNSSSITAGDVVSWIYFTNASGSRITADGYRFYLYTKNDSNSVTQMSLCINESKQTDADSNGIPDDAVCSFNNGDWYNIRFELEYQFDGSDTGNYNIVRRVYIDGELMFSAMMAKKDASDNLAKGFVLSERKTFEFDVDNVYCNAVPGDAAPGEGKYASEAETFDSYANGYATYNATMLKKTYDAGTIDTDDHFVYEMDFKWNNYSSSTDQGAVYLRFYNSKGAVTFSDSAQFLAIAVYGNDAYFGVYNRINKTGDSNDANGNGIYDNFEWGKMAKGEWYNIRLEMFLIAYGDSFTPVVDIYVNNELVKNDYYLYSGKAVSDRAASWAPYEMRFEARNGFNYNVDNLYAAPVKAPASGEYADAEGTVKDTVGYANSDATVAVPGTDGYLSDEILVFESDIRFNATNYTSATASKWAGAFSLTDANGNINTQSGRMGLFTNGSKIVLGWNADCDGWVLNEDGSVENALAELEFLKWYNVRYVYRHTVNSEGTYDRVVEFYLDGELIASKSDNPATGPVSELPDMTAGFIWNRNSNFSYSIANTYVGALDAKAIANGISYESIDKALAAANNGSTVKVLEALEVGTELTVPGEKNIYVELHAAENAGHLPALNQNVYTVIENEYFEFLGGSLRYEDAADGSTNIRLGYRFTDKFDFASNNWAWEYTLGSRPSTQLQGSAYNEENRNSNIVFTDVDVANYDKDITVRLGFTVNDGENLYIVFDVARTYTVLGVAEALMASDTASAESKAYAQTIIDAYNAANAE
ncbi:MAG: hypothetical protein IJ488_07350 [Clostridia bacterium]|nr:hypothetical protein [Clostridia bacterium]